MTNINTTQRPKGSVLLMMLIVIAIGAMLYFAQISTIFKPNLQHRKGHDEDRPWIHNNKLIPADQPIKTPNKKQPDLYTTVKATGKVNRNEAPRGSVDITIDQNGYVTAVWQADYTGTDTTTKIVANPTGNIFRNHRYKRPDGSTDKTRLFFIGKGTYNKFTQNAKTGIDVSENGICYLLGWLTKDDAMTDCTLTLTDKTHEYSIPYTVHEVELKRVTEQ